PARPHRQVVANARTEEAVAHRVGTRLTTCRLSPHLPDEDPHGWSTNPARHCHVVHRAFVWPRRRDVYARPPASPGLAGAAPHRAAVIRAGCDARCTPTAPVARQPREASRGLRRSDHE